MTFRKSLNDILNYSTATLLLVLSSSCVFGITLDDLEASGDFRFNATLEPNKGIAVTQEVSLYIDIATTGWFARGTEFELPELKNAIMIQRDKFATNSSVREGQKTWASQRWELSIFSMLEGQLDIPGIVLSINVSVPGKGIVTGKVTTPELSFEAKMPAEMKTKQNWLASPELIIEQDFDKPLDNLKVGDAIRQTITFKGEQVLAMMLPSYGPPELEGLSAYAKTPKLKDNNSRGAKLGERVEVIDYIVEKEGEYQLPSKTFHFWNTATKTHEQVTLPTAQFKVGEGLTRSVIKSVTDGVAVFSSFLTWKLVEILLATLVIVILLVIVIRKFSFGKGVTKGHSPKRITRNIKQASRDGDLKALARWLYIWMDYNESTIEISLRAFVQSFNSPQLLGQVEAVLQGAYSPMKAAHQVDIKVPNSAKAYLRSKFQKLPKSTVILTLEP